MTNPTPTLTILYAEDVTELRHVVAADLKRRGHDVIQAADGNEALLLFRERANEIDVVILDVRMPRIDGCAALLEMRLVRPDLRAVLVSGFTRETPELTRLLASGVPILIKPFRVADLAATIAQVAPETSR